MDILEQAAQVLHEEAQAIEQLITTLDQSFVNAVNMILACKGRVVCTGMGKSGHIGRKIAATLASTGTPALFMHPGEGVHGDLGMITEDDVVLAFSNSGETGEIIGILPSLRRIGAKLICVVGKPESTLAKNSDALAVCLLERHHFTPENFAVFHPGGSLGRRLLLTVENIMHGGEDNPVVHKGATVRDALFVMTEKGLGATSVIDEDGHLIGLVTDGDVRRGLDSGSNFLEWPVEDMMTNMPRTITKDKLAAEALHVMEKNQPRPITVLPVVDEDGHAMGIVHITDLLRRGIV